MARRKQFLLAIVDHDRRLFSIIGPLDSDRLWNESVLKAQDSGRDVRCFTVAEGKTKESAAHQYAEQMGFELVELARLEL
jgi:hypothetical protein